MKCQVLLFNQNDRGQVSRSRDSQLLAALGCFYLFSVLVVLLKPKDQFVLWYAKHGVLYTGLAIFFWITTFFGILSIFGLIGELVVLALAVTSSAKAMTGEKYLIPHVSPIAAKIELKWLTDILQK